MVAGRRRLPAALAVATPLATAGCGSGQSILAPHSHASREIDTLWWVMMIGGWIVFGVVVSILTVGYVRRRRVALAAASGDRLPYAIILIGGLFAPIIVLSLLFVLVLRTLPATSAPAAGATKLTIDVVGHRWWWEARYPGTAAVVANEIHIPTDTPVRIVGTTADVIHSFWVPELNRKIDLIPGRRNEVLLDAEQAGVYRGQCSEYCGVQHAHMAFAVYAEPPADFRRWLAHQEQPAERPAGGDALAGQQLFMSQACSGCHAIRGTPATGSYAPDLTHLASRHTIAALTLANTPGNLLSWISDPQRVKPGNLMPALQLSQSQFRDIVAYLRTLR